MFFIKLNHKSLKTNAKTFKFSVKNCFFDESNNIFIIYFEEFPIILIYRHDCKFIKKLSPSRVKNTTSVKIHSVVFSSYQNRLACLISGNCLSLWQYPKFDFEVKVKLDSSLCLQ